jgi:hypothetical protein
MVDIERHAISGNDIGVEDVDPLYVFSGIRAVLAGNRDLHWRYEIPLSIVMDAEIDPLFGLDQQPDSLPLVLVPVPILLPAQLSAQ